MSQTSTNQKKSLSLQTNLLFFSFALLLFASSNLAAQEPLSWEERYSAAWYEREARAGNLEAAYRLAELYRQGISVPIDLQRASDWYQVAAFGGVLEAQVRLADLHRRGELGKQNLEEAARWYRTAAKKGHAAAAFNLAVMLENGIGGPRDLDEAARFYETAYERGWSAAAMNRALLDMRPEREDLVSAMAWLIRAQDAGLSGSKSLAADLEQRLSAEELAEAQRLAEGTS